MRGNEMKHTPTMLRVLEDAAKRKGGFICPMRNVWAAAETAVLQGLRRRGLATDECSPRVTDEGRAILTKVKRNE